MDLKKKIYEHINAIKDIKKLSPKIQNAIDKIYLSIKNNNKILICGNGGSAADAQHLTAEFLVRLKPEVNRKPIPIINLVSDTSTLTACSNDYSFKKIFARNLKAFGNKDDVLISISTSGNSKNIIEVLKESKKKNIFSISFLGNKGGLAKKFSDLSLIVNSKNTATVQEAHIFLGHHIFENVEKKLFIGK